MKYLVLIHIDEQLRDALPASEYDAMMRGCFVKADAYQEAGSLLGSEQLQARSTAKSIRVRDGHTRITDGPFAETKEFLAGFNIIEAASEQEAMAIAQSFPWARIGCVELRPVMDMALVRQQMGG